MISFASIPHLIAARSKDWKKGYTTVAPILVPAGNRRAMKDILSPIPQAARKNTSGLRVGPTPACGVRLAGEETTAMTLATEIAERAETAESNNGKPKKPRVKNRNSLAV
jgi:hypothetical protein